jgi:hypothetical protein
MRRWSGAVAFALVGFVARCGAGSGLAVPGGTVSAEDSGLPGQVFCSLYEGPVPSCAPTPRSGPLQICDTDFPHCVRLPGFSAWACCTGGGPYNGPGGGCRFTGPWPSCPLFQAKVVIGAQPVSSDQTMVGQCLPTTLPVESNGAPNCTVVAARFPTGTGTPAQVAACKQCGETGLSFFPPSILASVSSKLAQYDCVCLVEAPSSQGCPMRPGQGGPSVSWCYENGGGATPCPGPWLAFDAPSTFGADLYMACFNP